jgi:hypothetical protein
MRAMAGILAWQARHPGSRTLAAARCEISRIASFRVARQPVPRDKCMTRMDFFAISSWHGAR